MGCSDSCLIPGLKRETTKIADFGSAKKAKKRPKDNDLRGTPQYMAPESISSHEYETHSDIWSLGCTVLEMITGRPPWPCDQNTKIGSILIKIGCTNQVPEIPNRVSKEAKDFLNKCLVRDPNARWTADMLLGHPFVTNTVDLPKPNAITNKCRCARSWLMRRKGLRDLSVLFHKVISPGFNN